MGKIFEVATRVLVCLGEDPDGGARDVAPLVEENRELVSPYTFVEDMPTLASDDPLLDDPRWTYLKTMSECA